MFALFAIFGNSIDVRFALDSDHSADIPDVPLGDVGRASLIGDLALTCRGEPSTASITDIWERGTARTLLGRPESPQDLYL